MKTTVFSSPCDTFFLDSAHKAGSSFNDGLNPWSRQKSSQPPSSRNPIKAAMSQTLLHAPCGMRSLELEVDKCTIISRHQNNNQHQNGKHHGARPRRNI